MNTSKGLGKHRKSLTSGTECASKDVSSQEVRENLPGPEQLEIERLKEDIIRSRRASQRLADEGRSCAVLLQAWFGTIERLCAEYELSLSEEIYMEFDDIVRRLSHRRSI